MIITDNAIEKLKQTFYGQIIQEGDSDYNELRKVWNDMFDKKPRLIMRCLTTKDVVSAVNFGREYHLLISVRGGGHNIAGFGTCENGLVIDLSLMIEIDVDSSNQKVKAQGGCLLSDLDIATQKFGLVVPAGIVSETGIGGLTLGGGFGWTSRKFGLTIDNLLSVELVTANGKIVTASASDNKELFWAIRGGGGNFGIVTSFEYKAHKIGTEVYSGIIVKPFDSAKDYIKFHREYVRKLPDEMTVWMVIRKVPPLPFVPEKHHGKLMVVIPFVYIGDQQEGAKLIQPIQKFNTSIGEQIQLNKWTTWQASFDGLSTKGARNYWKAHHITNLTDDFIEKVLEFAESMPSNDCEIFIPHMEGLPARIDPMETAFYHRSSPFMISIHARWKSIPNDKICIKWATDLYKATESYSKGVYVNFLSDEGSNRVKDAYSKKNWSKLLEVKKKWDPDNFFRLNQNINPND